MNFNDIADLIKSELMTEGKENIWENTKYQWIQEKSNTDKGKTGEHVIKKFHDIIGDQVGGRTSPENDLTINGEPVEVKSSCLNNSTRDFKWMNIRYDDNYKYMYIIGFYPYNIKVWKLTKKDILKYYNEGYIKNFSGGERNKTYKNWYIGVQTKKPETMDWLKNHEVNVMKYLLKANK